MGIGGGTEIQGCLLYTSEQLALRAARLEQALARQRACRKTLYEDRVDGAVTADVYKRQAHTSAKRLEDMRTA